ncbi:GNAT family N-acetyltransferase [Marinovum sp.]|uniref:GNAT family N-acetyltransferase n=1 Tax=Marinovum sp. TaxID=2024839 RepID=UPI002B270D6C|nr:GNAT family N-acetyltransferase [Marinovum sp.]
MMRPAGAEDVGTLRAFLAAHVETSMFLLGNLEAHGLERATDPKATRYFLWEEAGRLSGVFGVTPDGDLMCQMPAIPREAASAFASALQGHRIVGITGVAGQVERVLAELALPRDAWQMDEIEPLYRLELEALGASAEVIRAPGAGDLEMLEGWYLAYHLDTGLATGAQAKAQAARRARAAVGSDRHVLLIEDSRPVALSQHTVRAGSAVQIGGVFVPPPLRGQGLAGRVVAAQLHRLRAEDVETAILFAASTSAARAYERIGFRHIGHYRVAMLKAPQVLGVAA